MGDKQINKEILVRLITGPNIYGERERERERQFVRNNKHEIDKNYIKECLAPWYLSVVAGYTLHISDLWFISNPSLGASF